MSYTLYSHETPHLYTLTHPHVTTAFTKRYYSFASATLTYA